MKLRKIVDFMRLNFKIAFLLGLALILMSCDHDESVNAITSITNETSSFRILATKNEIANFIGKKNFKLIFRNQNTRNLVYLDYTSENPKLQEFSNGLDCYHPDISPDGRWVAFSTTFEASGGDSKIYAFDLNSATTNLVKLNAASAAIPRWQVFENGDTGLVYVSNTGLNQVEFWKSYTTSKVKFENGKFKSKRKIFGDGAFHGGISKDEAFAVTGAARLMARKTNEAGFYRDEIWYNDDQTCNASLFMDGTNRTLFLDMTGSQGVAFVGKKYGPHQYILVVDSTGKLINAVPSKPEMYNGVLKETAFDHTEWVTGEFAIGVIANVDDLIRRKVVLINMADSTILDLVEGDEEIWYPDFWVGDEI